VPASYRNAMVARLKIMCDLDIAERRKPQDGKIKFKKFGPLDIELRVATIPSAGGVEDVVMRILAAGEPIPLDKLGVLPHQPGQAQGDHFQALRPVLRLRPDRFRQDHHAALGAGLPEYAGHQDMDRRGSGRNHAEGPAPGADEQEGRMDFPMVMKAFLRADPDIIMVGEMRDKETTGIGIEASLTGHLVFATLHTNSAPESIIRLLDMGMDPFNFSDALLGILAQRLAKRLCKCKEAYTPDAEEMKSCS
jgi:type II secretory ATPase GspE/PulE/Tfp pilus assembly ATPase PilB-like protein